MPQGKVSERLLPRVAGRCRHLMRFARRHQSLALRLGSRAYLSMALAPVSGLLAGESLGSVRLRGYGHRLYYRLATSDAQVIRQVFAYREYECVASEPDVGYVIDCGANIGCATFYLLHRYPRAKAVVVEPDAANMALCRKNLAPLADRVTFVQAGVWSCSAPLVVERGSYRDGGAWAHQVRPARAGERPELIGKTMADLIAEAGFPRVDVLKMDIEAAEGEVFRSGTQAWLPLVRTLVIELHGAQCEAAVRAAMNPFVHTAQAAGDEMTVFRFSGGGGR